MYKTIVISAAIVASVASAQAANFSVAGTITPGACTLNLSGAGMMDNGMLSRATVMAYQVVLGGSEPVYKFPNVASTRLTVTCPGPTVVQLAYADNKAAAKIMLNFFDDYRGGITDGAGSAAIGAYSLWMNNVLVDGAGPAGFVDAPTGTINWVSSDFRVNMTGHAKGVVKTAGASTPAALTTLTSDLGSTVFLSKAYVDAATSSIVINGSGTVVLQYL